MSFKISIPSHITGFFNIVNNDNILKKGSCGAGFLLNKGVETIIKNTTKDKNIIMINGKVDKNKEPIINEVLKLIDIDYPIKIVQKIEVPVGCGLATSASQALGVAMGLCDDFIKAGQIAHIAEVNLGSGLGDVIAQNGKGLVIRKKPGAPGIGEIESIELENVYVGFKTFGEIRTSSIIQEDKYKKIINEKGEKELEKFMQNKCLNEFLKSSYIFSKESKLMNEELLEIVSKLNENNEILGSSMAMLGESVFAFSYEKNSFPDDFYVYKIDNKGILK